MSVRDFTNKHAVQILATQSRRADIGSTELCKIHFEMGKLLAYEMLDEFELAETEIEHVQGTRTGVELAAKNDLVIVVLMRAGLYAAEGVRSVFADSHFVLYSESDKLEIDLEHKTVIVVDAVINTGKTIVEVVDHLKKGKAKKIIVATLVMQKEAVQLADKYANVLFYALRISENKYVGKGGTDTGNRLFNTIVK
jgi:uracil phosphoribosyltransferase